MAGSIDRQDATDLLSYPGWLIPYALAETKEDHYRRASGTIPVPCGP